MVAQVRATLINPFPTRRRRFFAPAEIGTAHGPQAQLTGESVGLGGTPAQRRRARGPPRGLRTCLWPMDGL